MSDAIETLMTRNAELAAAKADRDFEWWQALCLVDNVAPTPLAVKQWLLDVNEYHEKELRDQLAAARKTIEAMKGREGRLREELKKAQVIVCDATCPSTWLSIEGKPVCSDICRKITAALAATDGGVS